MVLWNDKLVLIRPPTGVWKEYLTLLGESTHTFEKSAYVIGIVGTSTPTLYFSSRTMSEEIARTRAKGNVSYRGGLT